MKTLLVTEDTELRQRFEECLNTLGHYQIVSFDPHQIPVDGLFDHQDADLLVIDASSSALQGLRPIEQLIRRRRDTRSLVLLSEPNEVFTHQAIRAGASAALPAKIEKDALVKVLNLLSMDYNVIVLPKDASRQSTGQDSGLSRRELQILSLLCDGQQNKEIAHAFGIQEVTVKMHMRAIIRKLDARNRTHAAMIARDRGLLG